MHPANRIGVQFEKYVQRLLGDYGIRAKRNIMYHRGGRKHQIDLEYRAGLLFRSRTIVECKYVGRNSYLDFDNAFVQLGSAILFTASDEGILVTNSVIGKKESKEDYYHIKIYDLSDLLVLRFGRPDLSLQQRMESEIRGVRCSAADLSGLIHRYI